jgi:hypothetical protein
MLAALDIIASGCVADVSARPSGQALPRFVGCGRRRTPPRQRTNPVHHSCSAKVEVSTVHVLWFVRVKGAPYSVTDGIGDGCLMLASGFSICSLYSWQ